ncbi:hypothetical protein A0256_20200 [Mucilaginibacter sp. PAMC 26640]|nr:hypothetical protein A0256_20200 [Mucilaginibacter sp. PAMC 26640]
MEASTRILAVCTHEGILATILRLTNKNAEWHATGAESADEASALISGNDYHLILLGSGLTPEQEDQLAEIALGKSDAPKIIHHFGGGSGLLFGEIYQALGSK